MVIALVNGKPQGDGYDYTPPEVQMDDYSPPADTGSRFGAEATVEEEAPPEDYLPPVDNELPAEDYLPPSNEYLPP